MTAQSSVDLVLSESSLGKLYLSKTNPISVSEIKEAFPGYTVEYKLGYSEAGSMHYIKVTHHDEHLFSLFSYIEIGEGRAENAREFPLDLLVVHSPKIVDEYGIRVGDKLSKAISNREDELEFSANHFDNSFGAQKIYYNFEVTPVQKLHKEIGYVPAETVTPEYAIEDNPEIKAISWPKTRW